MFTVRQRKIFSKLENKKIKTYRLKGGREISVREPYSLKRDKKKKIVRIFCGRDEISFFGEDVAVVAIKRYISGHKFSLQREQKEKERKKIVKPVKKMGGFREAIEERNALLKRKPLENKKIFFKRNHPGK